MVGRRASDLGAVLGRAPAEGPDRVRRSRGQRVNLGHNRWPRTFYNENDPLKVAWLQWLMDEGLIAPGYIDPRPIQMLQPSDLIGYDHHHFCAGIGIWAYAAREAEWECDRPLWSASLPCQPFSAAGRRRGRDDPRHLWPHLFRLARACRPAVIVGEQASGALGRNWIDGVAADLGSERYGFRAVDIPAAAVDSPQIRQRHYWAALAGADGERPGRGTGEPGWHDGHGPTSRWEEGASWTASGDDGGAGLARTHGPGPHAAPPPGLRGGEEGRGARHVEPSGLHGAGAAQGRTAGQGSQGGQRRGRFGLEGREGQPADSVERSDARRGSPGDAQGVPPRIGWGEGFSEPGIQRWGPTATGANAPDRGAALGRPSRGGLALGVLGGGDGQPESRWVNVAGTDDRIQRANGSWWSGADWIICHDQKARRVADAGASLLAPGTPGRVLAWRGAGDAICGPLAIEVLKALKETM